MNLSDIKKHLPSMSNISDISQVTKGFSYDVKYFLHEESGSPKFVLRTSPKQQIQQKMQEYEAVTRIYERGVKTSRPIEFGSIEALDICYMILSYVEGEDASEILPSLSSDEQYQIGVEAGKELRVMHEIAAPVMESWHDRRLLKHNRQYESYRNSGVKLPEEDAILSFINNNLIHMTDRPNRFQHDDFHPSNLIVHHRCYSGVIDFNRYDWGDPYHDFLKIAYFSREVSIPFCIGQINGYFHNEVPQEFWKLYALYTAMIIFPTITWTLKVVPEQLESMLARIRVVLEDHKNFEEIVPLWYKEN
ncbi:aminoglycoside phosphotransferase family protein [Paenibacillus chondroitinus]|uniref:Aminoglycoside phosphotransferase family protein n=1 Tax=Paenibacillus chondroitinus TaxID=59842 RepID=A0ABU6DLC4_9BACL|nr:MULTISPECIES: aminoglycoside phosphotransferase family protein [Paenibacillus]MCY9660695.1 aminoglycoside phosphotransferase family protein [Paenibacillus anseongense]MEB4798125.1 aminoglycoside phosphotransferase family protein [Paenibacillus chondroitinus]